MGFCQQCVGGGHHEQNRVHIDDGLLHQNGSDAKGIAHNDDNKLNENHGDGQPHGTAPDYVVYTVNTAGQCPRMGG